MTTVQTKPAIFISYAHWDEPEKPREGEVQWLSFVTGYLKPAEKRGAVEVWTDRLMPGGVDWGSEIERKVRGCDIFILLVSRHSISSDYVVDQEIAIIRERQANGDDVHFYPLLLTPTPGIGLNIVRDKNLRPRDAKAFSSYSHDDRLQHMADVADEIVKIAEEIAARKRARPPPSEPLAPLSASAPTSSAPELIIPSPLPPNPRMIDREDRLDELVKAIRDEDRPVVVPGALGMGKTTLALAAAYHPRIIERFSKGRRFFVNLEPVPDADGLLRRLAADLGLAASGAATEVEAKIAAACAAVPTLAILDNLETPWRKDTKATETLLGRLAAIEGLRLILTVRGEPPNIPGPGAVTLQDVDRLSEADARALFLRRAGDHFATDFVLPDLVRSLGGHPLSIELLAANAQGKGGLRGLAADWRDRRADMLRQGAADDRKTSLRVSLAISLEALGPPSAAHRLIRLMALLPDGMSEADSRTILSDEEPTREERGAAARLEDARLASRPDGRWRLLAPVREVLLSSFPPEPEDKSRLLDRFLLRATQAESIGTKRWSEVREIMVEESGNFDAAIILAIKESVVPKATHAGILGLAEFHRLTGLATTTSLQRAQKRFHDDHDTLGEAHCVRSLGVISLARSDHTRAQNYLGQALALYTNVPDLCGKAFCIKSLGDIDLFWAKLNDARQRYLVALPLY